MTMIGPDGVALGFHFHPSDEELIGSILHRIVVDGDPIHRTAPYDTVLNSSEDLFGTKEPWEVWDEHGGDGLVLLPHLYFCCELKTVTKNGSRINRKVGGAGTWSEGPSSKTVFSNANPNSKEEPMGRKRNLRYENSNTKHPHHGKWLLDEYSIFVPPHDDGNHPKKPNSKRKMNSKTSQPITSRFVILRLRRNDKETKKPVIRNNNKKRKHCTEAEEIIIETSPTNKRMRSQDDQVVMGSQADCSTSSTPLPALSNALAFPDDDGYDVNWQRMRSQEDDDDQVVMGSQADQAGCSTSSTPLPALVFPNDDDYDLSNIDMEDIDIAAHIDWDSNPLLFDNFEFGGMVDYTGDLQLLQELLDRPAQEEPAMLW